MGKKSKTVCGPSLGLLVASLLVVLGPQANSATESSKTRVGEQVTSQAYTESVDLNSSAASTGSLSASGELRVKQPETKTWSAKYKSNHNFAKAEFESGDFKNIGSLGSAITLSYKLDDKKSVSLIQKFTTSRKEGTDDFTLNAFGLGISNSSLAKIARSDLVAAANYYLPTGSNEASGKNEFRTTFGWETTVAPKTTLSLGAQQRFYFYSKDLTNDQDRYLLLESADLAYALTDNFSFISSVGHGQGKKLFPSAGKPSQTDDIWLDLGFSAKIVPQIKVSLIMEHDEDVRNNKADGLYNDAETKYHLTLEASL